MDNTAKHLVQVAFGAFATLIVLALVAFLSPINDPGLPEIVYDRHGNAFSQQGEPVDCEVDIRC